MNPFTAECKILSMARVIICASDKFTIRRSLGMRALMFYLWDRFCLLFLRRSEARAIIYPGLFSGGAKFFVLLENGRASEQEEEEEEKKRD